MAALLLSMVCLLAFCAGCGARRSAPSSSETEPDTATAPAARAVHRGLRISEEPRRRFVELYLTALDAAGLPDDPAFREAVRKHIEFGSQVAMQNSHAEHDHELHPLREVP